LIEARRVPHLRSDGTSGREKWSAEAAAVARDRLRGGSSGQMSPGGGHPAAPTAAHTYQQPDRRPGLREGDDYVEWPTHRFRPEQDKRGPTPPYST